MGTHRALLIANLVVLAACASLPPPEPPKVPEYKGDQPVIRAPPPSNAKSAELWRQKAHKARGADDLRRAVDCWHVVTLLAPEDEQARRVLAALQQDLAERVQKSLTAGAAAVNKGDVDAASRALLKVVALDPENHEAIQMLRDIERDRIERIQAERAAQAQQEAYSGEPRKVRAVARQGDVPGYGELDQRLELFEAGDVGTGLTEFQRYVEARPKDKEGRQRIAVAVYQKARKFQNDGDDEQALLLYTRAAAFGGNGAPDANQRAQELRKQLSKKHFLEGQKIYRTDLAMAIKHWETAVKYDPANDEARSRLNDGLKMQETLKQIDRAKKTP